MHVVKREDRPQGSELPGHHDIYGSVLCNAGGLRVVLSSSGPGGYSEAHAHGVVQVFYVLGGSMEIDVDGKKSVLEPGDCAIVSPGESHAVRSSNASYLAIMPAPRSGE